MPFKKLVLPKLLEKPEVQAVKPLEPRVESAEILKVTPAEEEKQPIIIANLSKEPEKKPEKDPSKWSRILLDGDPISVMDITKVFPESNVFSGGITSQYISPLVAAASDLSFQASLIDIWNVYSVNETVALCFGTGPLRFQKNLAPNTGYLINLVKSIWRGPTNTPLNIYTFEPMGGLGAPYVTYTVFGENAT